MHARQNESLPWWERVDLLPGWVPDMALNHLSQHLDQKIFYFSQ